MTGHFPPSSRVTGVKCFAAADMIMRPTRGLPVALIKKTKTMSKLAFEKSKNKMVVFHTFETWTYSITIQSAIQRAKQNYFYMPQFKRILYTSHNN